MCAVKGSLFFNDIIQETWTCFSTRGVLFKLNKTPVNRPKLVQKSLSTKDRQGYKKDWEERHQSQF